MTTKSALPVDLFGDPWTPPRDPRGRKSHKPSAQGREIVAQLKGGGASDEEVARQLGISEPTLRKYYFRELDHGADLARNEIVRALYEKAKGGNVTAMRAYLAEVDKARLGELAYRGSRRRAAGQPEPAKPKLGLKAQRQAAAEQVGEGIYAPGAAPGRLN